VLVGCLRCSLGCNYIGAAGATAIGAGLQYLPSLTQLEYVRSMGHAEEAKEKLGGCVIAECACVCEVRAIVCMCVGWEDCMWV
jgi:hypothetical protein